MMPDPALAVPPFPPPLQHKAGLLRRFVIGWGSWIHTLFERSYRMKMGTVRFPLLRFFVINDLALAQDVLEERRCPWPKHGLMTELLRPLLGDSVFSANGAAWQAQRAMIQPAFAHAGLGRAFPAMRAAALDMADTLHQSAARGAVDMERAMTSVTADVIYRTLFSHSLSAEAADAVFAAFDRYQRHAQRYAMLRLYRLPLMRRRQRLTRAAADIRTLFAPLVDARMAARAHVDQPLPPADILDALLDARHPHSGAAFSREALLDQLGTIFLAGHETSASALAWASYLLAGDAGLQDRLAAQIAAVTAGNPLAADHLKALPELRHLFQEALRLYPPVSFLMREVVAPQTMRGKAMAPGDLAVVSPWLIQRNADNWACPHAFDPGRFARAENARAAREAWLPFGKGPRVCIGQGFAMQEATLVLATLLREFRLAPVPGRVPEPISRLTLRSRHGIHLRLTPR